MPTLQSIPANHFFNHLRAIKDVENQGKIGADDTYVVKGSGDTKLILLKAKEKGVVLKDVEDSSRLVISITTLQPLPTIDPKDKERERQDEASKAAIAEMFDEVQARIDVDYELAARMTQEEQEMYTIEERASQLKGKSYEEIQGLYERQQKRIQDFTPMDSEKEAQKPGKRLKRVAGSYATQKSPKKSKVMKSAKDVIEEEAAEYEQEKEELRADGSSSYHEDTQEFLRRLDRQDLNDLYSCGVHTLFMDGTPIEINMLVEKKYPLIKELLEKMLNLQLEDEEESTMVFELIKFIKSLLEE
ncbi:hypothetical protein Tco_0780876 [Tanacetum coccineum]